MKDYIETPCGKMPTDLFKRDYENKSDKEICDLINGEFVDPFALAEMEYRPNIILVENNRVTRVTEANHE